VRIVANEVPPIAPGQPPPEVLGRYVQALAGHLQKKHPESWESAVNLGHALTAWIWLQNFATDDPGVQANREMIRAFIHRMTRKNNARESDIQIRCEKFDGISESDHVQALEQFRDLRDYLLEEGEYAPGVPVEPQPVTTEPIPNNS
jgi:hypothetical protein